MDKTVRPREETLETHSKSLHYFHSFAVRDRCDITGLADEPSLPDMDNINVDLVLPTAADHISLKKNMTILMTRIIHKRIKFFNENVKVERHIAHCFSKEMSILSCIPLSTSTTLLLLALNAILLCIM